MLEAKANEGLILGFQVSKLVDMHSLVARLKGRQICADQNVR